MYHSFITEKKIKVNYSFYFNLSVKFGQLNILLNQYNDISISLDINVSKYIDLRIY